jgi:hypothetical protein
MAGWVSKAEAYQVKLCLGRGGVDDPLDLADAVRWESALLGMLSDHSSLGAMDTQ